jgi:hypothetical protein
MFNFFSRYSPPTGVWVIETGFWEDTGSWLDNETWED